MPTHKKVHKEKLFPLHLVKHLSSEHWTFYNWKKKKNQNSPPPGGYSKKKEELPYQEKKKRKKEWEEKQRKFHISKTQNKKEIK